MHESWFVPYAVAVMHERCDTQVKSSHLFIGLSGATSRAFNIGHRTHTCTCMCIKL
jgi:hypothetical protein